MAGKALTKAGVYAKMRDHAKLLSKVLSLQHPRQGLLTVDPQTQIFFDWGHKHEANGILSYLTANPSSVVHEVGFVLLDPTLQSLPEGVRQGINPNDLPVIGSSPDGIIVTPPPAPSTTPLPPQSLPPGAPAGSAPPAQPPHQYSPRQQHPQAPPPPQHWRQSNPSHRRVLEIKAKTPFRPDSLPGVWRWLGASCKPYSKILPQYFAQAQLNMLVTNSGSCHLLCYTVKGGSKLFTIPLDTQWCNQMLHWVAQLNTCYVRQGLEPPENVFWEQEAYRGFVDLTRAACQRLDGNAVEVPSQQGCMSSPWFLAATEAPVSDSLQAEPADQLSQQQLQWQLQSQLPPQLQEQQPPQLQSQLPPRPWNQLPPQCPPGWQQQQVAQLPAAVEQQTQQAQQQQQQGFSFNGSVAPSEAPAAGSAQPASLRLLAAAAIPLPDEDTTMEAHPSAAPQGQLDPALGHPQQTPMELDSAGPVGAEGLATWMQHICDQQGVDLRSLLDSSCWEALALLAADDLRHTLEQLVKYVKDVKEKTSALCMQNVDRFTAPKTKATCWKKKKTDGPSHAGSTPSTAANGRRAATHGPGAASFGPGAAGASLLMNSHHQPDPMDTGADFEGAADPASTRHIPVRLDAQGLGGIAARPALPGPGARAAATSPSTHAPASLPSPRPAFASPGTVHANASSTGAARGPQATLAGPAPIAAAVAGAQRALWPDSNDCWISHVTTAAPQPRVAANSPGGGPSSIRPALNRAGAAGPSAAAGLVQEVAALPELFGGKRLPADMVPNVQRRLHSVVAQHCMYLAPQDFDGAILDRLARMPEDRAMKVLNQAGSASWVQVQNNTRLIMSWCVRWGGHGQ